jgi:hypothetical protein
MKSHTSSAIENKLIEILVETFTKYGWQLIDFPEIYDSEEQPIGEWDYDNYLGVYRQTTTTWCDVGEIILYPKNIKKVAETFYDYDQLLIDPITGKYIYNANGEISKKSDLLHYLFNGSISPDYGIGFEEAVDYLTAIVLVHELTHWAIHWNCDFNQKSLRCDLRYEYEDEINFHEGLAQYFTDNTIRKLGLKKMIDLFDFLKQRQSYPYRVFEEFKTDLDGNEIDVACVFTALGVCWNNNFNQSFNELRKINYISVLYNPEDHQKSYQKIIQKKPAIDQTKIIDWWFKKPFSNPNYCLYEYFDFKNKTNYKTSYNSRKYGL